MIRLTLAEVAEAVGGRLDGGAAASTAVTGPVVVDSRLAAPGGLFVALPGARVDGHDYAGAAAVAGAVAAIAGRPVGRPAVVVADPLAALGRLAAHVLSRLPRLTVVGVTGSVGKTTTKDLLRALLDGLGPVVAPASSFNNEVGLPLTVLEADADTRLLVLEYGARGLGHIAHLCGIARPGVAVVLNVGSAHLGEFGTREAIAAAKSELVQALDPAGTAVLNADDRRVAAMAAQTSARVVTAGTSPAADVRALDVEVGGDGRARFTLATPEASAPVRLRLVGGHQVANAVSAAAAAMALGVDLAEVADRLSAAEPVSRWRMEVRERPDGVTVVNDAYNANPESVAAALHALAGMAGARRSWAVLGEMAELGSAAADAHHGVGRLAARLGVARVLAVGPAAAGIAAGAAAEAGSGTGGPRYAGAGPDRVGQRADLVAGPDEAVAVLAAELRAGDVVLVKASRAVGLERVADALLSAPAVGGTDPGAGAADRAGAGDRRRVG